MKDKNALYKCDVCGRKMHKKIRLGGFTLCSKHMHQLLKYGKFLDNIQRTNSDLNDFKINYDKNIVIFNIYNQKNIKNGEFIIDLEDLDKVRYKKWRISHDRPMTGLPSKGTDRTVAHDILGVHSKKTNLVIDHIDGDAYNNRKENLRLISQANNVKNQALNKLNTSGFKGVSFDKDRNSWASEIRCDLKRVHFKRQKKKEFAVYQRMVAEKILYKEFAREFEINRMYEFTKHIDEDIKKSLKKDVILKLKKHNLVH